MAQKLLKDQFCSLNGLESTLLQAKEVWLKTCEREHWIVSTVTNYSHQFHFKSIDYETRSKTH